VDRLEKVGLAGSILPDDHHHTGREIKLRLSVGAEVPERESADDQPASRIGMSR